MTLAVMSAFGICPPHMLININKTPSAEQHMATGPISLAPSLCHRFCLLCAGLISTGVCVYVLPRHTCCPCGNQVKYLRARARKVSLCPGALVLHW